MGEQPTYSVIRADVENYLLSAYPWQLRDRNLVEQQLRERLQDPQADPEANARELEQISRSDFADWLRQKGLFTQTEVNQLADSLETIRREMLVALQAASEREKLVSLHRDVEQYILLTPREELTPEAIHGSLAGILDDPNGDYAQLSARLSQFDRGMFEGLLHQRQNLEPEAVPGIAQEMMLARDRLLDRAQDRERSAREKAEDLWNKIQGYLQNTSNLQGSNLEHELSLLLKDPEAGAAALRLRASRYNREELVRTLATRGDLSEAQVNDLLDRVERNWTRIRFAPQRLAGQLQAQYEQTTSAIADYLRNTGREELNPEGIQRDLSRLLSEPKAGAKAIQHRLAAMDRETLVQLLAQRQDLSEEQVNQIIDEVLGTLRRLANSPRRLASRAQQRAINFRDSLQDYLRNTGREELNPLGIQRDLKLLLHDPQAGAESLKERLAAMDRDTLVALLSQRQDMSEEDANRIVAQVLGRAR
ncbi:MAG: MFS transporter, partial [Chloroflexaceae bacterium]|nr:MFS transporter [Chloroflexaceae bacterium]